LYIELHITHIKKEYRMKRISMTSAALLALGSFAPSFGATALEAMYGMSMPVSQDITLLPIDLANLQRKTAAGIRYFPELSFFEGFRPGESQKTTMAIMAVYPNGHERRATITRDGRSFVMLLGNQGDPNLVKQTASNKDELLNKLADFFGKQ
jgi:hypothetical protein